MNALEELQRDPASRRRFLKMVGGGGAGALALAVAACGGSATKSATSKPATQSSGGNGMGGDKGDMAILQYALTLEHLETAFYDKVGASGLFKGSTLETLKAFGEQESRHVQALEATIEKLGGTPNPAPKTQFPIKSAKQVAKLAATVENLGAAAYLGQAPNISGKDVLAAALSIHSVEARHAATLNELIGAGATPDGAFAKPASMSTVLAAVKPFIVS